MGRGNGACASWIRRPENRVLVAVGQPKSGTSPPLLEVFSFDAKTASLSADPLATFAMGEEDPIGFAVHPSGEEIVCSTAKGCRLFELCNRDLTYKLVAKDLPPLRSAGPQNCLAFSTDGSKFVTGGQDGHLRILEWPSLKVLLDEPRAHKSFRDMDIRGSTDGDICVVEVKKMEISHWSKKLHPGAAIASIEFCPSERIVISSSNQRGAVITKLNVPADWKEWQLYLLLVSLFLGSAVIFYLFHQHSDSLWNFPLGRNQPSRPYFKAIVHDSQLADDQSPW